MVRKINKNYKYVLQDTKTKEMSKPFHMVEDNKKIKSGQMLSSLHCNVEVCVNEDIPISILKMDRLDNIIKEFNILIPKQKLQTAYNELKKKKRSDLFVTSISHFNEIWELNYSIYIDFQVFPCDTKCDYILVTLPTFKIQYFE
tara:strand:- start:7013 stop:7444 length:432 start_codon:yes stop_codon:yes gene_type:complete